MALKDRLADSAAVVAIVLISLISHLAVRSAPHKINGAAIRLATRTARGSGLRVGGTGLLGYSSTGVEGVGWLCDNCDNRR